MGGVGGPLCDTQLKDIYIYKYYICAAVFSFPPSRFDLITVTRAGTPTLKIIIHRSTLYVYRDELGI